MKRTLAPAAVLCLASLLPCAISAQQTASTPPPLPKDPVALLKSAWQENGVHGPDVQPWHVRATWTDVDEKGRATSTGTWEEWWAGEKKYRISYSSGSFQQNLFVTDHGAFATGSADAPNWEFELIQHAVISPIPDPQHLSKFAWHETGRSGGPSRSPARGSLLCRLCLLSEREILAISIVLPMSFRRCVFTSVMTKR